MILKKTPELISFKVIEKSEKIIINSPKNLIHIGFLFYIRNNNISTANNPFMLNNFFLIKDTVIK